MAPSSKTGGLFSANSRKFSPVVRLERLRLPDGIQVSRQSDENASLVSSNDSSANDGGGSGSSSRRRSSNNNSGGGLEDMLPSTSTSAEVCLTVDDTRRVTRGQLRKLPEDSSKSQPQAKKARLDHQSAPTSKCNESTTAKTKWSKQRKPRCSKCYQLKDDLVFFSGDPDGAINEFSLLDRDDLLLQDGAENGDKPVVKISNLTVYDENGHLCHFDSGLLEKNCRLFMSGLVNSVIDDDATPTSSIPVMYIGPIISWWFSGFDGGKLLLGLSTEAFNYYVEGAAPEYEPFMGCMEKIRLIKYIIEYLDDNPSNSFEEMCDHTKAKDVRLNDEMILMHAAFILSQLASYDSVADADELAFLSTRAARRLQELAGAQEHTTPRRKGLPRGAVPRKKVRDTLATTTPLVFQLLNGFCGEQMNASSSIESNCGNCDRCRCKPCMTCTGCKSNSKHCLRKRCENKKTAIVMDDVSDEEDVEDEMDRRVKASKEKTKRKIHINDKMASTVVWMKPPVLVHKGRKYYCSAKVDHIEISNGDCLMFEPETGDLPYVGKVQYMYEKGDEKFLHVIWFWRGSDTLLDQSTDASQVFVTNSCDSVPAGSVVAKCSVEYMQSAKNFRAPGHSQSDNRFEKFHANGKKNAFYYTLFYDDVTASFTSPPVDIACEDEKLMYRFCTACCGKHAAEQSEKAVLGRRVGDSKVSEYSSFNLRGEKFTIGECVLVDPAACTTLPSRTFGPPKAKNPDKFKDDPEKYPERYRKRNDTVGGLNVNVPDPFMVGRILSISSSSSNGNNEDKLHLALFYRPENTYRGDSSCYSTDYNVLYWTEKTITVPLSMVRSKCVVAYAGNIKDLESFRTQGPYRFYFQEVYNVSKKEFKNVPSEAKSYSGKGVGKAYEDYPVVTEKLKALDVFAGCGGLSDGFHRAGVSETCWAIENSSAAAEAFKRNNPDCAVFEEDCNELLKRMMDGETHDSKGQELPQRGKVDIVMGGPPCQGFSGLNRFNNREYSRFKNSLVATFLSFCDYLRPRYFLLENVRNFVSYKRGMVLKLVLNCLVQMGYQCGFAVLQAGHYGIPQTRRRLIIWAAASGEKLPKFPEPQHVFNKRGGQLSVCIDDNKFVSNIWTNSAPYRCVTVHDAISDLPPIECGASDVSISYAGPAVSHFQRIVRGNGKVLKDHVTKEMSELNMARFSYIPCEPGADWRDLPNIDVVVDGRVIARKLEYKYKDKHGKMRGVCSCASGLVAFCNLADHQSYTLIPWCLPHTGCRHGHWRYLFGRIYLFGYFCTTITNPEPMGKQGCVLHPTQHRVVSVRECARSQGFSDLYYFTGKILDRYRQIGNAVPPPLAEALAMELRKCLF